MRKFDTNQIIAQISSKAQSFQPLAESFAKSRFLLATIEYGQNEEETAALEKIAAGIKVAITQTSEGVSLNVDFDDNDAGNYLEIVQDGMPAPVTGGAGGFVHNPDGSVTTSNVPPALWGNLIPEFSKSGSETLEEVKTMLTSLFVDEIERLIQDSTSEIENMAKSYIEASIKHVLLK